ncbi:BZ3500_MvSof-1268-A1-R1_Chr6-3g08749 [Microbotryum saponariae]|uniref:Glutathione peroxidase n=1 Tax=Microbotryum saponariae TaxID=289078 RepID=A0A2X0LPG4_9BASI|nr:BZ3500_MvSof-1268-A1-R1_Chr6-3g08749 [Microbotryum saponariae]SDA07350.1 BZ3501_MvSof-1269-A2-R1_Chr6-2g08452 [Microbotryum saponariae]
MSSATTFYDLKAPLPGADKTYDFKDLKGKVVLIVNTASKCGFTKQYDGLEALYRKYKGKGFELLGFPCNQFGGQEPGTDEDVASFCTLNHGVSFPLMKKVRILPDTAVYKPFALLTAGSSHLYQSDVNGDSTNEVFQYLKTKQPGIFGTTMIKWSVTVIRLEKCMHRAELIERIPIPHRNFTKFLVDGEGNVVARYSSTTTPESIDKDIAKLIEGSALSPREPQDE